MCMTTSPKTAILRGKTHFYDKFFFAVDNLRQIVFYLLIPPSAGTSGTPKTSECNCTEPTLRFSF